MKNKNNWLKSSIFKLGADMRKTGRADLDFLQGSSGGMITRDLHYFFVTSRILLFSFRGAALPSERCSSGRTCTNKSQFNNE